MDTAIKRPRVVKLVNAGHNTFDTRIFQKEALTLVKAGYEVSIIKPHEADVFVQGVQIEAVPLPDKGWKQLIVCPWNIFKKALKHSRTSIYHIHDSELLLIGLLLRLTGRRMVYDAHEDTPRQISYQHWIPWWIKKPYAWFYFILEKLAGWSFEAIIVAEPIIARYYPKRKTRLIRNFSMVRSFQTKENIKPYKDREKIITYVGILSEPRGLFEMVKAHSLAKQTDQNIVFKIGGKFSPSRLEQEILSQYPVTFIGWVPYEKLTDVLYEAQIGIIIPQPNPRYTTNYPVKLFEYMAAGIPVIASKFGESALFVKECNGGLLVDPQNTREVADAILWLLQNPAEAEAMGKRGQEMIFKTYNWEVESERLLSLYSSFSN
jgi:glycosyltransferase involved in cell wall biosynthesis